jgi:hypothetical protein
VTTNEQSSFVQEATIMRNQWAKLGGVLGVAYCIAGFVLIFFGWNGAASNDTVEAQLPYIVSGGIAGLALVVLGAALIVAHSLRGDRVELKGAIDDLRRSVAGGGVGGGVGGGASGTRGATGRAGGGGDVVAGAQSYHLPDCTVVAGQSAASRMAAPDAVAAGLEPCRICHPDRLVA